MHDPRTSPSQRNQAPIIKQSQRRIKRQWQIYDIYVDDGYSGKDTNRPNSENVLTANDIGFEPVTELFDTTTHLGKTTTSVVLLAT